MAVWRSPSIRKPQAGKQPQENIFGRLLDPIDWLVETIFAILVLLTYTLAFTVYELYGNPDAPITVEMVNQLLVGILGVTLGWGVINGTLYTLASVFERGEKHRILSAIQTAGSQEEGVNVIAEELDYILEPITRQEDRQLLYAEILDYLRDGQAQPVRLTREDLYGALGCILVALIAVLPALLPLVLLRNNYELAIRLSNLIAFVILFISGYQWGKYSGTHPWKTGLLLLSIGFPLVLIAILLGG